MREYVGTIVKVSRETFTLACNGPTGQRQLSAKFTSPESTKDLPVGKKVKITGDWAGNLGAGALTTFSVREIEVLS